MLSALEHAQYRNNSMTVDSKPLAKAPAGTLLMAVLAGLLVGCGSKATCDNPTATARMIELARQGVITDLADQCATKLFNKIPAASNACSATAEDSGKKCQTACKVWAQQAVSSKVLEVKTAFTDDTIATVRCVASVRFDVEFEGGQKVTTDIAYLVAKQNGNLMVALSQ